jgi:hypothetical protein
MARETPEQTRANRRRYTLEELYEQEERRQQRRKPPMPPEKKGPERRTPEGMLDRALVMKFKNGGAVQARGCGAMMNNRRRPTQVR